MFGITHRSIVFSAAALLTFVTWAAAAQEAPLLPDPSRSTPQIQSDVTADDSDDAELVLAEPDFRVLNLPSTLRLPLHGSSFQLTHPAGSIRGQLSEGSFDPGTAVPS